MADQDGVRNLNRLCRLLRLIDLLQNGRPIPADQIAQRFGISRRTLFRDLAILRDAGIPHNIVHEDGPGLSIPHTLFSTPPALAEQQTIGLMLNLKLLQPLNDNPHIRHAQHFIETLLDAAPRDMRKRCSELLQTIRIDMPMLRLPRRFQRRFLRLQLHAHLNAPCFMKVNSPNGDGITELIYQPKHLRLTERGWLVHGRDTNARVRIFRIREILTVHVAPRSRKRCSPA